MDTWTQTQLARWRRTREPEILGALLKAQRGRAYGIARRLVRCEADAEDAVQEAFVKLLSRTAGFGDTDAFEMAVYRAVTQCALDALRRKTCRATHEAASRLDLAARAGDATMPAPQPKHETSHIREALRRAVEDLPDDERAPVMLCFYQGLPVAKTAQVLELPRGTVRARLARALSALRRRLKQEEAVLNAPAILGMLWADGSPSVPAGLCARLDLALPGSTCAAAPALPQPGPAATPASLGLHGLAHSAKGLATSAAVLAALCTAAWNYAPPTPTHAAASGRATELRNTGPGETGSAAVPPAGRRGEPKSNPVEENIEMNKKLGILGVMGGALLAGSAQAADPSPEAAKVINEIAARQAAKAEAREKVAKRNLDAERRTAGSPGGEEVRVIHAGGDAVKIQIQEGDND